MVSGANWAPISAISKALTPAKWSSLSSTTSGLILAKVKYRLRPGRAAAGAYTNNISWIATPIY
jgi:hypothetical protein